MRNTTVAEWPLIPFFGGVLSLLWNIFWNIVAPSFNRWACALNLLFFFFSYLADKSTARKVKYGMVVWTKPFRMLIPRKWAQILGIETHVAESKVLIQAKDRASFQESFIQGQPKTFKHALEGEVTMLAEARFKLTAYWDFVCIFFAREHTAWWNGMIDIVPLQQYAIHVSETIGTHLT